MPERLKALPTFCCIEEDDRLNLWPDAPHSSYSEANELGRARAAELVNVIRRTGSPSILSHVFEAIATKRKMGGVEIGFFHALSMELMTPVVVQQFIEVPREREFHTTRQMGNLRLVS
jgi:hypothetical protein